LKTKSREVNIFNMSLLDILCGALGAFCFMMLVLFPYWKPAGMEAADRAQDAEQLEREIQDLRKALSEANSADAAGLQKRVNGLQQSINKLQGQLNKATQDLQQKDQQLAQFEMRNPVVLATQSWQANQDLDLYVEWDYAKEKQPYPKADPNKKQWEYYAGEARVDCKSACAEMWLIRDVPAGRSFTLFYKYLTSTGNPAPPAYTAYYLHDGAFKRLPVAKLQRPGTMMRAGVFKMSGDYRLSFEPDPSLAAAYDQILKEEKQKAK
jgi:hypothetical protein